MTGRLTHPHHRSTGEGFARRAVRVGLALAQVLVLIAGSTASAARADDAKVGGELLVILASEADGTIDPSLSSLRALKHPPFNNFKSMKILSRSALELLPDQAHELELPNGRWLQITLRARRPDGRAKVQVSINRAQQKDYLPLLEVIASPGEPFFVAGQKYQGGTLVIGFRIGERRAKK